MQVLSNNNAPGSIIFKLSLWETLGCVCSFNFSTQVSLLVCGAFISTVQVLPALIIVLNEIYIFNYLVN